LQTYPIALHPLRMLFADRLAHHAPNVHVSVVIELVR
jgi:hypothetical protein